MEKAFVFPLRGECDNLDAQLNMWVRGILAMRKRRSASFGADLFSDQSWDLILLLAIAPAAGMTRSELASVCERSDEITRRWLGILIERNFVEEAEDLRCRLTAHTLGLLQSILSASSSALRAA